MLEFFRTYQRFFFIAITAVIILSFLFFGAASTENLEHLDCETGASAPITHTVTGHPVSLAEIQDLCRFIACAAEPVSDSQGKINLCNDGVLRNDFMKTGLDTLLHTAYPEAAQKNFPFIAAQFILHAAAVAEQKGYRVSPEEAKGDLFHNFQTSLGALLKEKTILAAPSMAQHLKTLGFQEASAVNVWRKVLLFRKYFQGAASASFIDRLPFKDFFSYAQEGVAVQLYQWPPEMRFQTFEELIAFEVYLSAIAPPRENPLDLPSAYYSLAEIATEYPELIQTAYTARIQEVSLATASLRIPLKELWDWQEDSEHWALLSQNFPFLPQELPREERLSTLNRLKSKERFAADIFSRIQILSSHPQWIEAILKDAPGREDTIEASPQSVSLQSIQKPWKLSQYLQRASQGDETAKQALLHYSDDGKTLYCIRDVEAAHSPRLLSLAEAKEKGILDPIVERRLWAFYEKTKSSKGEIRKSFFEVKRDLAKTMFSEVLRAIEDTSPSLPHDDSYAQFRLLHPAQAMLKKLQNGSPSYENDGKDTQFAFIKNKRIIQRTTPEEWMKEQAFTKLPEQWSAIHVPDNGDISFFYIEHKHAQTRPILDPISFGKELIAADAQMYLAEKLLKTITLNNSMIIPKEPAL